MPGACSASCFWPLHEAMALALCSIALASCFGIYSAAPRSLRSLPAAHWPPPSLAAAARGRCLVLPSGLVRLIAAHTVCIPRLLATLFSSSRRLSERGLQQQEEVLAEEEGPKGAGSEEAQGRGKGEQLLQRAAGSRQQAVPP